MENQALSPFFLPSRTTSTTTHMKKLSLILLLLAPFAMYAQDLLDMLDEMEEEKREFTIATFKTTRVVNAQSIEMPAPGVMQLNISHRFGKLNGGFYDLFGLDQANMRFDFEYGLTPWLALGVGRSNINKTYDGSLKLKLLRQSSGKFVMPISLAYAGGIAVNTLRWADPDRENFFSSRLTYYHQLLIARKFGDRLSLQLTPTVIHRNLVATTQDENDVYAVGIGGRFKVSGGVTVNAEYFYLLPGWPGTGYTAGINENSLSIGVDIETGGHVFQLIFSNSLGMTPNYFVTETFDTWQSGGVRFGFNLSRVFTVSKKANLWDGRDL